MPQDIADRHGRMLRIGLGAKTAREARAEAELLAALARTLFSQIRTARMQNGHAGDDGSEMLAAIGAAEVKGYLMAIRDQLQSPPPTPPHQEPAFEGFRGLVQLNRELAKGPQGNPLVVENAEIITARYLDRIRETTDIDGGSRQLPPQPPEPPSSTLLRKETGAAPSPAHLPSDFEASPASPTQSAATDAGTTAGGSLPGAPFVTRVYRDENGKVIPASRLDRRYVQRKPSELPKLSEVAHDYFAAREVKLGQGHKDIKTARMRLGVFLDLIGDHPVDTYTAADLQAFIALMTHWPAEERHRPADKSPREILAGNADLRFRPLKRAALEDGYVATARAIIRFQMAHHGYTDPFLGAKLTYPSTAAPRQATEPLSSEQKNRIFQTGVAGGLLDEALLPLLGDLTGRRLGLLVHLQGSDIREKYPGVFVAQTSGIVLSEGGQWRRVPIKTDQSTTFFVLHDFLREIGFVDWARAQGQAFLFPELTRLVDPSKSASSYMQRLFRKAGVSGNGREVFHSLRGGHIDFMRKAKVDARDRRLQAGHKIDDEHDLYGFRAIAEDRAYEIAQAKLDERVDYSVFRRLDFEKLARAKRTYGRRSRPKGTDDL